ncbi:MAG: aminotransferase class IV [Pseudoclavibacter sp.]
MTSHHDGVRIPAEPVPAAVIDSLLVRDGRAVRPLAHLERFLAATATAFADVAPSRAEVDRAWSAGLESIPREGAWFPLIEARRSAGSETVVTVDLIVRPAPPLRETTRLAIAPDRRSFPLLKGADGERTASDRGAAREAGDDDALYLDADGRVIEAANGAVIGWRRAAAGEGGGPRGGLTLVLPATDRALPSTTVAAMLEELASGGRHIDELRDRPAHPEPVGGTARNTARVPPATVTVSPFTPDDVDELWYVNALHGITPVVSIDGAERAHDQDLLAAWRAAAEGWWVPL